MLGMITKDVKVVRAVAGVARSPFWGRGLLVAPLG